MNEQQKISLLAEAAHKALETADGTEPVQIIDGELSRIEKECPELLIIER